MQKPSLQGEMIVLRPIRPDDADAMWDMLADPEGNRLTGTTRVFTQDEVRAWCASREEAQGRYDFAVTTSADDEYHGEIVLNDVDEDVQCAGLRLAMRPAYRGRGYGTEAIELVLGFAFDGLGLHRVELEALSINTRAISLYENIGFRREGRRRDAYRDGAGWCDAVVMSMLEDEYRAGRTGG
ncbi:GNAT family N-acetyltransferase [Cellulomonas dongxiuzhuiae]|uniref:GNAT family N-acetyltransferase n=1 Tax=Cellulomonas dongxiuzhuiae TaxID=2819979 RepID=A0ABX8GLM9_9CELL|nr:GNAT family protein [Cellulomonas dongxiuzhuiae]MBO3090247.1 GNAT family N-acetyltransferase [Cellulomonas dongxiuzhuiae]MBO3095753.1 GNAT family N-acetyltransferase [Cellulomonas dongxiuzhuiae]QWC17067.1 GNAT family N-acetyltransferase [Cellulomonas dongxiuzhuiae]